MYVKEFKNVVIKVKQTSHTGMTIFLWFSFLCPFKFGMFTIAKKYRGYRVKWGRNLQNATLSSKMVQFGYLSGS